MWRWLFGGAKAPPRDAVLYTRRGCPCCETARAELIKRGVAVSEITVFDERDGGTFFGFADPDGNTWAVQQIVARADKPLIPAEHR